MRITSGNAVLTGERRRLVLGALIRSGGSGSVYQLPASPLQVAKIYHDGADGVTHERKLAAMLELSPNLPDIVEGGHRYVQIAWPQTLLREGGGRCVGFAMPAVDVQATSELECILQEKQARALGLPTGLGAKVTLAANLAAVIVALHQQGHRVIDLKPLNLRFYPASLYMALLDCDGFSIRGSSGHFAADRITPDYLAPEFQNGLVTPPGEEQQDCFALAVVIFQLLNFGIHPFTGRPLSGQVPTDIPSRIARRCYAYGAHANPDLAPSPVSGHASIPADLRALFDRAFQSTGEPRPAAREWAAALKIYAQRSSGRLIGCDRNAAHQHFRDWPCAACARADLLEATAQQVHAAGVARIASAHATVAMNGLRGFGRAKARRLAPSSRAYALARAKPTRTPAPQRTRSRASPARPGRLRQRIRVIVIAGCAVITSVLLASLLAEWNQSRRAAILTAPTPTPTPHARIVAAQPVAAGLPKRLADGTYPVTDPSTLQPSAQQQATSTTLVAAAHAMASGERAAFTAQMGLLHAAQQQPSPTSGGIYKSVFEDYAAHAPGQAAAARGSLYNNLVIAQEQFPHDAETRFELGWMNLSDGRRERARFWFEQALGVDPDFGAAWYGYAVAAGSQEQSLGAIAIADTLAPDPDSSARMRRLFSPGLLAALGIDPTGFESLREQGLALAGRMRSASP